MVINRAVFLFTREEDRGHTLLSLPLPLSLNNDKPLTNLQRRADADTVVLVNELALYLVTVGVLPRGNKVV